MALLVIAGVVGTLLRSALGRTKGSDADYYKVWARLPRETRDYVPLMVAAARLAKDPYPEVPAPR